VERASLELRPGVNVLVGPNGAGKTNILEALYFLYKALVDAPRKTPYLPHAPEYYSPLDLVYAKDPSRMLEYILRFHYTIRVERGGEPRFYSTTLGATIRFAVSADQSTIEPIYFETSYGGDARLIVSRGEVRVYIRDDILAALEDVKGAPQEVRGLLARVRKTLEEARLEDDYRVLAYKDPAGATGGVLLPLRLSYRWKPPSDLTRLAPCMLGCFFTPALRGRPPPSPLACRLARAEPGEWRGLTLPPIAPPLPHVPAPV
jgi:hypothetical protein